MRLMNVRVHVPGTICEFGAPSREFNAEGLCLCPEQWVPSVTPSFVSDWLHPSLEARAGIFRSISCPGPAKQEDCIPQDRGQPILKFLFPGDSLEVGTRGVRVCKCQRCEVLLRLAFWVKGFGAVNLGDTLRRALRRW